MKKLLFAVAVMATVTTSCGPTQVVVETRSAAPPPQPPPSAPADPEVTYQTFYDDLSPYGEWIDYPGYGYVWRPDVGPDFKPYSTNGHWVYSDAGWVWASDYNWGWATFHYGRWFFQDGYGWMWIPGYEWSPAWVSWRRSQDYYGWAPLGPNISINVSFGGGYNPPAHYWNFVPQQYVTSPHINNYYVNETKNTTIINNTTVINNTTIINNNVTNNNVTNNNITNNHINNTTVNNTTINRNTYAGGPDPREVETVTGAQLRPVVLRTSNRPGEQNNNGQLSLFHPRVNAVPPPGSTGSNTNRAAGTPSTSATAPAPSRVQSFRDMRPSPNLTRPATGANNSVPPANNAQPVNNIQTANNGLPVRTAPPANNVPQANNNRPGNNNPPVNTLAPGNSRPPGSYGNTSGNSNTRGNSNTSGNNNSNANVNGNANNNASNNSNGNGNGTGNNNNNGNRNSNGNAAGNRNNNPNNPPVNNNANNTGNYRPGVFPTNRTIQQGRPQTQQQSGAPRNDTTRRSPKKFPPHPQPVPPKPA